MKFRNNRIPYLFPGWLDGEPVQMQLKDIYEFTGTIVDETEDRYVIAIDQECLNDGSPQVRIEWLKECTEVVEP